MQEKRRPPGKRIIKSSPKPDTEEKKSSGKRTTIIIALTFLVIITITVFVSIYFFYWKDLWRPIITINNETVNMDYFIRRLRYVDKTNDVFKMFVEVIPHEMLIRQGAPRYGLEVIPDEMDELLRDVAQGDNETISENEFNAWYRNELNETKLSDTEYREWARTHALEYELHMYLIENMPTIAEQVHLHIIILPSYDDAETAISRVQNGEDFSDLAQELSLDEDTGEQGGDAGWWPEGAGLHTSLESVAFNLQEIDQVHGIPILIDDEIGIYAICKVTERQMAREIEEDKLEVLKSGLLEEWLLTERSNSTVIFSGMDWSESEQRYVFGAKTLAWIELQLAK